MRLQRFGHANCAFYKIVVAQARFRRNGRYHDILGTYYPHPSSLYNTQPTIASGNGNQSNTDSSDVVSRYKHVALDFEKAKYWLSVGAEPTSMVAKLFSKVCTLIYILQSSSSL